MPKEQDSSSNHKPGTKNFSNHSTNPLDSTNTSHTNLRPKENELYRPTLLQLKCRGALHLSSPGHQAVCKGLPNRLETIREYPPMKPRQALHAFQHQISLYSPDGQANDPVFQAGFGGQGSVGHVQQRRTHSSSSHEQQSEVHLPYVVDDKWDEMRRTLQEQTSLDLSGLDKTESEMTLYGTSSVYFLVLKPYSEINAAIIKSVNQEQQLQQRHPQQQDQQQKKKHENEQMDEEIKQQHELNVAVDATNPKSSMPPTKSFIYAVNPVNELGISKRKVSSVEDGIACSSTTIKLGILEIHMASLEELDPESVDGAADATLSSNTARYTNTNKNNADGRNGNDEDIKQEEKALMPAKSSPTKSLNLPSYQEIQRFIEKVDKFGDRLLDQMYQNAKFIKGEFENDFLNRTWKASEKVAGSLEKNWMRMKKNLVETIKFFTDSGRD